MRLTRPITLLESLGVKREEGVKRDGLFMIMAKGETDKWRLKETEHWGGLLSGGVHWYLHSLWYVMSHRLLSKSVKTKWNELIKCSISWSLCTEATQVSQNNGKAVDHEGRHQKWVTTNNYIRRRHQCWWYSIRLELITDLLSLTKYMFSICWFDFLTCSSLLHLTTFDFPLCDSQVHHTVWA